VSERLDVDQPIPLPDHSSVEDGGLHPEFVQDAIWVRGAREHNLRDIDVRIPREKLVVITGLSGSGKSSLAFDTIYAEGQRRYVESLSAYARAFLDQMARPDVDSIEGLSPAISIEQKSVSANPRSTVGTVTEIFDYLRLLYARVGQPQCPGCGQPISSQTLQQMTERVMSIDEGTRVQILAPVIRGRKGSYRKELEAFRRQGFVRVRIDGEMHDLSDDVQIARHARHDIDVVIDRLVINQRVEARLSGSIETALKLADGIVRVDVADGNEPWLLSQKSACATCGISLPELAPRLFSFNSPAGACPQCAGLGDHAVLDAARVVPDAKRPLAKAIEPWQRGRGSGYYRQLIEALALHYDVDPTTPWGKLPQRARDGILHGTSGEAVRFEIKRGGQTSNVSRPWNGVMDELERRAEAGDTDAERGKANRELARFRSPLQCDACDGSRLRPEARNVTLAGRGIHELSALSTSALRRFLEGLELSEAQSLVADRILSEINERLGFLADVGLDYLSLDRRSGTLSGGEAQRIRLATQIGSSLMGVLYILDEPSIGLHPRDNQRLLDSLLRLRDMGNTLLVVEHDEATIRTADYVIDMGPGAGIHGGRVAAEGTPDELQQNESSPTGAYLSGRRSIPLPRRRREADERAIVLSGCTEHNLRDVELSIPIGLFTVMTGVSGSGKSTLVNDTLHRALAQRLHAATATPGAFSRLEGLEHIDKVIDVDQAPIGRTPRSNPTTYSGAFDGIRKLFAGVPEARMRGYGSGRFSFNVKGGRCEACGGDGLLRVEMHFLPDLFVQCEVCKGRRYNRETLAVRYKQRSIADVLDLTVEEALSVFENVGSVHRPLLALHEVGLDYLHLGQPATTLSGGEAQRIKLARELAKRSTGRTLYLLDEPTTGLHFADVEKLLELLQRLVDLGNTVLVIEHHLDVIKTADLVVDLGPEGGEAGGEIVAAGTPEEVAANPRSHTGRALAQLLLR
jgi:excinuclease ABC subunit A